MFLPEDDSGDRPYSVYGEPQHKCTECGDEIDNPGLCIFCFAIASLNIDDDEEGEGEVTPC